MTRTSYRPLAAVGLVLALLGYVGCSSPKTVDTATPAKKQTEAPKPEKTAEKDTGSQLFAGWPAPLAAIVITGDMLGYLEPCGCTAGQLGGLLRRAEFVEQLGVKQKWPLALFDLGSLIKDPAQARGGPEQTKIKLNTALKALSTLKYDALALSPEDLKVGVDEAVGQFLNIPGDKLKVVAANVKAAGLESKVVPSLRAKAGTATIGVTAVVDPDTFKALKDPSLDLLDVKPIDDTLPAVLADLEKDTKAQVLLVQGSPELAKTLAQKYKGFDVVVATSISDPKDDAERLNDGKTLLVSVGIKGKYLGVVGLFDDPKEPLRYRRATLGPKFDGPAAAMKKVIEDEFRETLKAQGVVENFPRHDYVNGASGATFLGAESCKTCHPNTYARWATTKHAKAFESLLTDPKPNTAFDAECVSCHTTGFEYTSGWKSPTATAYLKGNQCENCHGPASKHAGEPDNAEFRSLLHLTAAQADKNGLCLRCHDEDNSPHFDFSTYYGKIVHKGLDTYTDPNVHKGLPPKVATQDAK